MRGFIASIIVTITVLLAAAATAGELKVGAAAVVITPPPGTPLAGYYTERPADGVHDDLHAKAIVIEQDGSKVALVACDLVTLTRPVVEEARQQIEKQTGLAGDRVMISATHTHTGPLVLGNSSLTDNIGGKSSLAQQYRAKLPGLIAQSVAEANAKLAPAKASAGVGMTKGLVFNRRFFLKDGRVGWNPKKQDPNIFKPAGPVDPTVPVVYFESADGKPVATYVNFAMHQDTVGGTKISADYAFPLSADLGKVRGDAMLTLFTIGTAGDANQRDINSADPQKGFDEAAKIGGVLAAEVQKLYGTMKPVESFAPRVRSRIIPLDLPKFTDEDVAKARKVATTFGKNAAPFMDQVQAYKVLDVYARQGRPQEVEVQVIALSNDLAFVSLPGEIFTELGLYVKRRSPFKQTVIAELANGSVGYIPTRIAYEEGNYEPVSSRCAPGSGERLAAEAVKLLYELKKEK